MSWATCEFKTSTQIPKDMRENIRAGHPVLPDGDGTDKPGVTFRALLIGSLMALFIGLVLPYTNMIIKGSLLAHNLNTPAAIFVFFVFVGIVNVVLGIIGRQYALSPPELAVVYIMAMLATAIPTIGFSEYLLPIVAGIYYYASPENKWEEIIHPYVPKWIAPQDPEAIRYFYEGLPEGLSVPWDVWIEPILYWCLFILASYWVSICLMVMVRRQWIEHEKLLYPLVQVPLAMIQDEERGAGSNNEKRSWVKPFFKNPVMWIGFSIPFLLGSYSALYNYFPFIPGMSQFSDQGILTGQFTFFRNTTVLIVMFNLGLVGFAYLLSRDVALGLWLFFLVSNIERGVFNMLGIQSAEKLSRFANSSGPYLAHQAMGAMIVLVLSGLWMGRSHLKGVFSKAFKGGEEIDDRDEILSYRTAVWGLLVGLLIISAWLWKSGLPPWVVPVFLFAVFVVFMALTRAVVEGGVAVIRTPLTPADFVVSGLGTSVLGASGIVALGFTYVWAANIRIFFMPCFANALKIAELLKGDRRMLIWGVALAMVIALVSSIWSVMTLSYTYGGVNLHGFWFIGVPRNAANYMAVILSNPTSAQIGGWLFTGLGALVMGLLAYIRARFVWWPVHPLGFATSTFFIMNYVWFSVFIAWAIKSVVLKYGGPGLYNSTKPFFLGLIMGQIFVAGMWLVIDYFTGMVGNQPIGGSFV